MMPLSSDFMVRWPSFSSMGDCSGEDMHAGPSPIPGAATFTSNTVSDMIGDSLQIHNGGFVLDFVDTHVCVGVWMHVAA